MRVFLHEVRVASEALAEAEGPAEEQNATGLDLHAKHAQVLAIGPARRPAHGRVDGDERLGHHLELHAPHEGHHGLDVDAVRHRHAALDGLGARVERVACH